VRVFDASAVLAALLQERGGDQAQALMEEGGGRWLPHGCARGRERSACRSAIAVAWRSAVCSAYRSSPPNARGNRSRTSIW
jgi:hypothetical protein